MLNFTASIQCLVDGMKWVARLAACLSISEFKRRKRKTEVQSKLKAAVQGHGQGFPVASEFIKEDYHDDYEEFATEALPALKEVGVMDAKSKVKVNTFLNRLFGVQLALQANIFQHCKIVILSRFACCLSR